MHLEIIKFSALQCGINLWSYDTSKNSNYKDGFENCGIVFIIIVWLLASTKLESTPIAILVLTPTHTATISVFCTYMNFDGWWKEGSFFVNDFQFSALKFQCLFRKQFHFDFSFIVSMPCTRCLHRSLSLCLFALQFFFRFIVLCCCLTYTIQYSLASAMCLCVCRKTNLQRKWRLIINCICFDWMWLRMCVSVCRMLLHHLLNSNWSASFYCFHLCSRA